MVQARIKQGLPLARASPGSRDGDRFVVRDAYELVLLYVLIIEAQTFLEILDSLSISQFVENPVRKQTNIDENILLWEFTLKAIKPELKIR